MARPFSGSLVCWCCVFQASWLSELFFSIIILFTSQITFNLLSKIKWKMVPLKLCAPIGWLSLITWGSSYNGYLQASISYPCSDSGVAFQSAKGTWAWQCSTPVTCSLSVELGNHKNSMRWDAMVEYHSDKTLSIQASFGFNGSEMSRLNCVVRKVDLAVTAVDFKFLWLFLCWQGLIFFFFWSFFKDTEY